jgi:hypothetical protein
MTDWILRLNPFELMIYGMLLWGALQCACFAAGCWLTRKGGMKQ